MHQVVGQDVPLPPDAAGVPRVAAPLPTAPRPGPNLQIRSARGFEWTRITLPVRGLAASLHGLRILHLTDLHARPYWDPAYDDLIAATKANPPDLLLFTGDFVDNRYDHRPGLPTIQKLFAALPSRLGTFAIQGNHDGDLIAPQLSEVGVTLITQRLLTLAAPDASIELIGLPGVDRQDLDDSFVRSVPPRTDAALRIVLSHFPNLILRTATLKPDLYLTGHTHGGQICLPGRIPITRHDTLPRRLCTGIHRAYDTWLIANRGMGFSSRLQVRLFCPAEVIEITVTGSADHPT